jgi:hypothetical protein
VGMITILSALVSLLSFRVPSRASLELELVALRHQVTILRRQRLGQLRLFSTDRPLWVWLYRVWPRSSTPCAPSSVTTKAAHAMHARLCCSPHLGSVSASSPFVCLEWRARAAFAETARCIGANSECSFASASNASAASNARLRQPSICVEFPRRAGAGKKEVAVLFKDLKVVSRDGKDWLVLNQTKDKLKMAPAHDKKTNSSM